MPDSPEQPRNPLETFERYLDRQPLSEDLAEIRAGKMPGDEPLHPAEVTNGATREVTDRGGLLDWKPNRRELVALSEIVDSEGWHILRNLLKKRLENLRETAITFSQNDPLRNKDAIADEWAYHAIQRKVLDDMELIVAEQLERLKVKE